MSGTELGRLSLRLDAVYCVVLGLAVAVLAPYADTVVGLPTITVVVLGVLTAGWGGFVWWATRWHSLRRALRLVMIANLAASAALAVVGFAGATLLLTLAAVALSVDVAAFGASQGIALRRLRTA